MFLLASYSFSISSIKYQTIDNEKHVSTTFTLEKEKISVTTLSQARKHPGDNRKGDHGKGLR